jgi:hypothetical protein
MNRLISSGLAARLIALATGCVAKPVTEVLVGPRGDSSAIGGDTGTANLEGENPADTPDGDFVGKVGGDALIGFSLRGTRVKAYAGGSHVGDSAGRIRVLAKKTVGRRDRDGSSDRPLTESEAQGPAGQPRHVACS